MNALRQCSRADGGRIVHLQVDTASPVPPYEQIRAQLQTMVTSGALPEGTRLPPIRQLAGDLGLATNTVGRAYHELELDGLVATRGRHGTVVRSGATLAAPEREEVVAQAADAFALEAQHHGAGLDDALAAVRQAFQRLRDGGAPIPGNEAAT
jgi:GntR family transcriptional regulator